MGNLITISGVRGFIDENGVAQLNLEDVARGFGFTKNEIKNEKEYISVRWERVFGYLSEFGFDHKWAKDDFIPENMVYRLGFKANNEVAQSFQAKLADEILPAIRKTGAYMVGIDQSKLSPQMQTLALMVQQLAQMDIQAQEAKQIALEAKNEIRELTAKVKTIPEEYYSIAGYASLRGIKVDISKAGLLGRKASKLSKEYDIDVGKAYDPRFGQVNTYHLDVLKEVFCGIEQDVS